MRLYPLDSEYKARWEEYHLDSGVMMDSRVVNWRNVEWERLNKLVIVIREQRYEVTNSDPGFKAFIRFRITGKINGKPMNTWMVGWTNGKVCFMNEFDFKTGEHKKHNVVVPLKKLKSFVHPRVKARLGM